VSLILEALRKLEREKGAPERGFTVFAATPWPVRSRVRLATAVVAGGLLVAAGVAVGLALRPGPPAPPAAAPAATPTPVADAPPVFAPPPAAGPLAPPRRPVPPAATSPPAPAAEAATPDPLPTAPPSPADEPLRLQAISEQDGRPVAVLNERIVREGDEFDGIRVIRIGAGEVEVAVRGQRRVLKF
jgi:hypothetical protein